jgi:hypothetical protein
MEDTKQFGGGMHDDFDPQNQPQNTYQNALNIIRELDGGIKSEKGGVDVVTPLNKTIIGSCSIGSSNILFLYDAGGQHEIGVVDVNNTYTQKLKTPELNFQLNNQKISAVAELNYKGESIVYFSDGVNPDRYLNLSQPPTTDIANQLKLDIHSKVPNVSLTSITNDGALPTGIYIFQVRLLTSSTNRTIPSLMTNPIPIINETGNKQIVNGALPQTESFKSINLTIDNLDTNFKTYEVLMTTYEGLASVPRTYIIGRKSIVGSSSTFTVSSLDETLEEVTTDEVTIEPVVYTSSKHIHSKDGYLLRSNLKGKLEGNSFQKVANAAVVNYIIKTEDYSEVINFSTANDAVVETGSATSTDGYHNEAFCVNYKSWMRGEVYDIAIVPKYKDGTTGSAYHIPAHITSREASTLDKSLGSYISDEVYPSGFGYPETSGTPTNIRFHKMPSLAQEPIINTGGSVSQIRILGVKVTVNLNLLTSEERNAIDGWILVRQRRTATNRRILTQGIAQSLFKCVSEAINPLLMVSPFTGGTEVLGPAVNAAYKRKHIAFYSPETIFNGEIPRGSKLEEVSKAVGKAYLTGFNYVETTSSSKPKENVTNIFTDYTSFNLLTAPTSYNIDSNTIRLIPAGADDIDSVSNIMDLGTGDRINLNNNNGFLFFKIDNDLQFAHPKGDLRYLDYANTSQRLEMLNSSGSYARYGISPNLSGVSYGETHRNIYNIVSTSRRLYGNLTGASYVYVGHTSGNDLEVYNGDTFINKVAIMSMTSDYNEAASDGTKKQTASFNTLSYVFLESTVNTAYRHSIDKVLTEKGTVPFYPKQKLLYDKNKQNGLFNVKAYYGHSNGYNQQYSFDNGLKKFFPKPLLLDGEVINFSNRIIYSERSIEGEQFNAKRMFLPNNYHDVPRDKGGITECFTNGEGFYIRTERSIFQASFNERTAITTTAGQVALGNGGLFPLPSKEIYAADGGYAGGYSLSCFTPFGRIWIDENQGKLFMFSQSIEEISLTGKRHFFGKQDKRLNHVLDNYSSTYDFMNRRYILSCNDWCITYHPELQSFTSYHSYKPNHLFSNGKKVYMSIGSVLQELNVGDISTYFSNKNRVEIIVPFNDNPLITKVFDNLLLQSNTPFSTIQVYNSTLDSGEKPIIYNNEYLDNGQEVVNVKFKNSQYQLPIPRSGEQRIKGKYSIIKLTTEDDMYTKYLTVLYRGSAR